ncbi:MAG: PPC domain-containing protein [Gemmataceae bacterium]|nr:PPC domain-containing protein [Gemmataceae bacterium]
MISRRSRCLASIALILALPALLDAAPPTLTRVSPRGAERGKTVEIIVVGANLTPQSQLVLPFKGTAALVADAKPNPAQARFQLTVDPSVPFGVYPLRVATDDGISALFFFCVDHIANINEVEDNSTFDKAQKIAIPTIVNGECAAGDVDFFRFEAKKGQRLVIETESARLGSGLLPQLRLTDGKQRFLAADDSQSLRGDCRIHFDVPADGEYVVEISDSRYKGAPPPFYRLKIAEYDVIQEVFPLGGKRGEMVTFTLRGGSLAKEVQVQRRLEDPLTPGTMPLSLEGVLKVGMLSPQLAVGDLPERLWIKADGKDPKTLDVLPPVVINSRLERKGDTDRFQFPVEVGQRYRIAVQAEALGSSLDGVLRVLDQAGKQLALVDDVDIPSPVPGQPPLKGADPSLDFTVPMGVNLLILELSDQRHRGGINFGYRLTIVPAVADFELRLPFAEINVPRGGTAALTVQVVRRSYLGPIQLSVPNLPAGVTVQGGDVPANGTAGVLTITSTAQAPAAPVAIRIEGKATSEGKEIRRMAEHKIVVSREVSPAASVLTFTDVTLALAAADPFALQGPPIVEVVKGFPVMVPVTLTRGMTVANLPIEVSATVPGFTPAAGQPAPPGTFTIQPTNAAAGAGNATFNLATGANAPEGKQNLVVQGKVKINNVDRLVVGPAVSLVVVRPFNVEVDPKVTLTPGQMVAIKGKINRQAVFKDAVTLKLDGLPAGVTLAKPLAPIAPGSTEFQIELKVDPKYATPAASLTLTASTTLGAMPYAHPAVTVAAAIK